MPLDAPSQLDEATWIRRRLADVFADLDAEVFAALAPIVEFVELARGQRLIAAGDRADAMYVVLRGKLLALPPDTDAPAHGVVGHDDVVGARALFTDGRYGADVVALRPAQVARISRSHFEELTDRHPAFMRFVIRATIELRRRHDSTRCDARPSRRTLAILALDSCDAVARVAAELGAALGRVARCRVVGPAELELDATTPSRLVTHPLDAEEAGTEVLILAPRRLGCPLAERALQHADHVVLIADAGADPELRDGEPNERDPDPRLARTRSLVLVHAANTTRPVGTSRWLAPRVLDTHYHVRDGRTADLERVARLLTGRGVGLVLSGGGALAGAHVGVLAALLERGVPLDYVGGTSAGGGIAAVVALEHDYERIHDTLVTHFIARNPIKRPTLPRASLVDGRPLDRTARRMFGAMDIEDLWLPWFAVSTKLGSARPHVHRRGPLWRAARATTSVPGLMPPVLDHGDVLVDGGVLDNFPSPTMKALCGGPVIGSHARGDDGSRWRSARARRAPSIPEVLTRVATIGHHAGETNQARACSIYFEPDLADFSSRDFKRFPELARAGYDHACAVLSRSDLAATIPGWEHGPSPSHDRPDPSFGPARARFGVRRAEPEPSPVTTATETMTTEAHAAPDTRPQTLSPWLSFDVNSWIHVAFIVATVAAVALLGWWGLLVYPALHLFTDLLYYICGVQVFDPAATVARGYQISLHLNDAPHSAGLDYGCNFYDGEYDKTRGQAQLDKFEHAWRALELAPGMRLIDVGCGCGDWLAWLAARGVEVVGVNLTREQVEVCRARGLTVHWTDYKRVATDPALSAELLGRFDRVTFWDTVEHYVPMKYRKNKRARDRIYTELFELADQLLRAPDGRVWISCLHMRDEPAQRSWSRGLRLTAWAYMLDKFHSGCYPSSVDDCLVRNASPRFELLRREDLTLDYFMTSKLERAHFGRHRFEWSAARVLVLAQLILVDPYWFHRFLWLANESWMRQFHEHDIDRSDVVLFWLLLRRAPRAGAR